MILKMCNSRNKDPACLQRAEERKRKVHMHNIWGKKVVRLLNNYFQLPFLVILKANDH